LPQIQFLLSEDVFVTFVISQDLVRATIKAMSPNLSAKTTVATSKLWVGNFSRKL